MILFVVLWLNALPPDRVIHQTCSPRKINMDSNLYYTKHCKVDFGHMQRLMMMQLPPTPWIIDQKRLYSQVPLKTSSSAANSLVSVRHRWELPILNYCKIMLIYPYPFFGGNYPIVLLSNIYSWFYMYINWFTWVIFIHDFICYTINWG